MLYSLFYLGSDLKNKTVVGLDKLYEALDAVPESGTSSVSVTEASAEKFKSLLDQISPTATTVEAAEEHVYMPTDYEEMSVTDGDNDQPVGDNFKGLFDTIRPGADDQLGRVMGKIGQTTLSLASQTRNKLTPAMQGLASKVKKKIIEIPKRRLRKHDLEADVRQLLFREPQAMEALESIQILSCRTSIELKRMRKAGRLVAPFFRDDPTMVVKRSKLQLDSINGWQEFVCLMDYYFMSYFIGNELWIRVRTGPKSRNNSASFAGEKLG